jgi:hypothetical protein
MLPWAAPFARPTGGNMVGIFDSQDRHAAVIRTKAGYAF